MRVPDEVLECVCFLRVERGGFPPAVGSAFFVGVDVGFEDRIVVYAVTAKHCITGKWGTLPDDVGLRLNQRAGGSDVVHTDPTDWLYHPTADIAALPITPDRTIFRYRVYSIASGATQPFIGERHIGPGDDVFMPGLLVHHPGKTRMMPVVRLGSIAAFPQDPVNISTGPDVVGLLEARSIGGVSGSPVFVHLPFWRDTEKGDLFVGGGAKGASGGEHRLLGLVHGFYPVKSNDPEGVSGGDENMNTGIAIVILIERILDLVNRQDQVAMRETLKQKLEAEQSPTPTAAVAPDVEPTEFERFEDLARKLVQVPKRNVDEKRKDESYRCPVTSA